jgi:hypothetical protein
LAGLPLDPDLPTSYYQSPPSPSIGSFLANVEKRDKYWGSWRGCGRAGKGWGCKVCSGLPLKEAVPPGSSLDKALEYRIHWPRTLESEPVGNAAPEPTVKSVDWKPGWGSGPQPHGDSSYSNPDPQKECCHDQDLLKRHHNIAKVIPTQGTP